MAIIVDFLAFSLNLQESCYTVKCPVGVFFSALGKRITPIYDTFIWQQINTIKKAFNRLI